MPPNDGSPRARVEPLARIVGEAHCLLQPAPDDPRLVDQRRLFRGRALAVVRPGSTEEVSAVVRHCVDHSLAVVPQGGNTGQCGGAVPHGDAVLLSTERLRRVRAVDADEFTLVAEAGCVLADLQAVAETHDCLFPLSLGAEGSCSIGGNLSTNAGGINVLRYGSARELTLGLEVVLPDGRIWNGLRTLRKDNTGYALKHLFVGAEGTLGIITAAALRLFPRPARLHTAMLAIASPRAAVATLRRLRHACGETVSACELIPRVALDYGFRHLPGGRDPFAAVHPWYLLVEVGASRADAAGGGARDAIEAPIAEAIEEGDARDAVIAESGEQRRALWRLREIAAGGHQHQEGGIVKHDVSVPVGRVPDLVERGTAAVAAALPGTRVVAFGHVGDGNLHFNLLQPPGWAPEAFFAERERLNRVVHDVVHALGGSVSAEHGIGLLRIDEMARYKSGTELDLMRRVKAALDPLGLMNPGKVLPA